MHKRWGGRETKTKAKERFKAEWERKWRGGEQREGPVEDTCRDRDRQRRARRIEERARSKEREMRRRQREE